jgi:hypothetical protein
MSRRDQISVENSHADARQRDKIARVQNVEAKLTENEEILACHSVLISIEHNSS